MRLDEEGGGGVLNLSAGRKSLSTRRRLSSRCWKNQSIPQRVDSPAFADLIQNESNPSTFAISSSCGLRLKGGRGRFSLALSVAEGSLTTRSPGLSRAQRGKQSRGATLLLWSRLTRCANSSTLLTSIGERNASRRLESASKSFAV